MTLTGVSPIASTIPDSLARAIALQKKRGGMGKGFQLSGTDQSVLQVISEIREKWSVKFMGFGAHANNSPRSL